MPMNTSDWFERITGFPETSYEDTRQRLRVDGRWLICGERSYGVGTLELLTLQTLRDRVKSDGPNAGTSKPKVSITTGDVRRMHAEQTYAGAIFQVASQFNLLEMTSPDVTPEHGVSQYAYDRTQGPACAIAAGAATIYRNYFVPVGDGPDKGQTRSRQLDGLAGIAQALESALHVPTGALWEMRNGYALPTERVLRDLGMYLRSAHEDEIDELRSLLAIGVHSDVEVTGAPEPELGSLNRPLVSQAFCSALPVAYTRIAHGVWRPFAILVLEAAYEATLLAGIMNARRGASNIVLLTLLGGGAFGNEEHWILDAMGRALRVVGAMGLGLQLDVRVVSYGRPRAGLVKLVGNHSARDA